MSQVQKDQATVTSPTQSTSERQTTTKYVEEGNQRYFISVITQNGMRRVEIYMPQLKKNYRKCIIPMCICREFITTLKKVMVEITELKKTEANEDLLSYNLIQISQLTTQGGRNYRFDYHLGDKGNDLSIACLFNKYRYKLFICESAIPRIITILTQFLISHPSLTPNEDFPFQPRSNETVINSSTSEGKAYFLGNKSINHGTSRYNGRGESRTTPITVLQTPGPIAIGVPTSLKEYKIEVVKGEKVFLRVSEFLSTNLKSSIHIPLELVKLLGSEIANYDQKIISSATKQ